MTKYNGHKNHNRWNVSLWLNNDEALYRAMRSDIRAARTKDRAARRMLEDLVDIGITHTPDGAPYSVSAIRAAMVGV